MAEIAAGGNDRIDFLLDHLIASWENLPNAARQIDDWDLVAQIDYVEEWSPKLALAKELERVMATATPTEAQRGRYKKLQQLMRKHKAVLEQLRAS